MRVEEPIEVRHLAASIVVRLKILTVVLKVAFFRHKFVRLVSERTGGVSMSVKPVRQFAMAVEIPTVIHAFRPLSQVPCDLGMVPHKDAKAAELFFGRCLILWVQKLV